jgi:hypothetical protein
MILHYRPGFNPKAFVVQESGDETGIRDNSDQRKIGGIILSQTYETFHVWLFTCRSLSTSFPAVSPTSKNVNRAIRNNLGSLDPDKYLDEMGAAFLLEFL